MQLCLLLMFRLTFLGVIDFSNNKGTALYFISSNAQLIHNSHTSFINNTGDNGGAILLGDNSAINISRLLLKAPFYK